jgi:2-phospho-L-lactate transferase/gluconeogenesis factor (CofD/UPF0052 family)
MKTNYINQLQRDIMRDCDHTDSTQEQSILSIEHRAEKSFKAHNIGQHDLANDVYTDGFIEGANEMIPIIKELGEALKVAKNVIPVTENGNTDFAISPIYTLIQTTLDKYKQYL